MTTFAGQLIQLGIPSGGELAVAIASRTILVIEEIKQRYSSGNVLIVPHKATTELCCVVCWELM